MNFAAGQQTLSWFRDVYQAGKLTIKPPFQRKPVWGGKQKCSLIESILERYPVPEIFLQVTTTEDGVTTYAVVDGQQRVRTVLQFIGADKDPEEQAENKFVLDKLAPTSVWSNKSFADLTADQKKSFFGYQFATRELNTESDDEVRQMFMRLNKYLTPLKPQELRNATYTGPFAQLAESLADDEYWAENRIITAAAIRRMADIEFVAELLIGVIHGPQGGSAAIIDDYYQQYEDFEDEFPEQKQTARIFGETLRLVKALFPDIKMSRWSNKTDFYTLFVAAASLLRSGSVSAANQAAMKRALDRFERDVEKRIQDDSVPVSASVIDYVRAASKGANDKSRRGTRHQALLPIVSRFFTAKQK